MAPPTTTAPNHSAHLGALLQAGEKDRGRPGIRHQEGLVQDRLRRAVVAHDVCGQAPGGCQGGADALRLNRAHLQKHDCFVLDFQNNSEAITYAFQDYYRATLLSEESDPNKLHDLKAALDRAQVYSQEHVQAIVELFLGGAERDQLDPILDSCVAVYVNTLDEDQQVDFKGNAKIFLACFRPALCLACRPNAVVVGVVGYLSYLSAP